MITSKAVERLIPGLMMVAIIISLILVPFTNKTNNKGISQPYEKTIFAPGKRIDIQIEIPVNSWKKLLDNPEKKTYYSCNVTINGITYANVGIRSKGSSSLEDVKYNNSDRYSLMLNFDKYVKDALAYDMAAYIGLPAPMYNYAKVTLNGKFHGCYMAIEPITDAFLKRNYGTSKGTVYEPFGSLEYIDEKLSSYNDITEKIKHGKASKKSKENIFNAIKSVHTDIDIEKYVNVESIMKYMALQTIAINYDGLTGSDPHNYYLYDNNGYISIIPWDYNLAFGGYTDQGNMDFWDDMDLGNETNSDGIITEEEMEQAFQDYFNNLSEEEKKAFQESYVFDNATEVNKYVNFPIDTPFTGDLSTKSFFMNLLKNDTYKAMYYKYLTILSSKYIQGGQLNKTITTITNEIGEIAGTESNAFYSNEQFYIATETIKKLLLFKSQSVMGQINGRIPTTWEAQAKDGSSLIDASSINLKDMGGSFD